MLDDRYFQELGEPSREKLERLPIWARVYVFSLRADAIWWELASRGRTGSRRRAVKEPSPERISGLPVFAADWIRTLRFEVFWWRVQTFKRSQRLDGGRSASGSVNQPKGVESCPVPLKPPSIDRGSWSSVASPQS